MHRTDTGNETSFSLWHSGSASLEGQSDGPLSPSDIHTSVIKSEAAYVIRRLTSRCLERKQPSLVGVSPLCDVVSSFFCHTHIQTEKISSWNGPTLHVCCFMLARASTKTFVSRVQKTAKKSSLARSLVSRGITISIFLNISEGYEHLHYLHLYCSP